MMLPKEYYDLDFVRGALKDIADIKPEDLLEELKKTRMLYSYVDGIIRNSYDGIYITDGRANTLYVNESYARIAGIKKEEVVGKNLKELQSTLISQSAALRTLEEKKPITIEQVFLRTGKKVLTTTSPVFDESGNIVLIIANIRDITDLEELKERLAQEEQLLSRYQWEVEALKEQLFEKAEMIAASDGMLAVIHKANKAAAADSTVMLLGETGVGKEEVAKYIHQNSMRRNQHFIKVNCGAISEGLVESELFGYEKGAFTGANQKGKMGLFEVAHKGTILLDEIGEFPLHLQVKLLRVLQEREVERIGGVEPISVDVRVIGTTNRDLASMVKEGKFRADLFYRLNVIPITIAPLRERKKDVVPLAGKFIDDLNIKYGLNKKMSSEMKTALTLYHWPGNVRELRNIIERAMIMSSADLLTSVDMPFNSAENIQELDFDGNMDLKEVMQKIEYAYIKKAYEKAGNVRDAARSVNMKHSAFGKKLKTYREKYDA